MSPSSSTPADKSFPMTALNHSDQLEASVQRYNCASETLKRESEKLILLAKEGEKLVGKLETKRVTDVSRPRKIKPKEIEARDFDQERSAALEATLQRQQARVNEAKREQAIHSHYLKVGQRWIRKFEARIKEIGSAEDLLEDELLIGLMTEPEEGDAGASGSRNAPHEQQQDMKLHGNIDSEDSAVQFMPQYDGQNERGGDDDEKDTFINQTPTSTQQSQQRSHSPPRYTYIPRPPRHLTHSPQPQPPSPRPMQPSFSNPSPLLTHSSPRLRTFSPTDQDHHFLPPLPAHRPLNHAEWLRLPPSADNVRPFTVSLCTYGEQGEILPFELGVVDLAFLLRQRIKGMGWSDDRVRRTVEDWMLRPMIDVREV